MKRFGTIILIIIGITFSLEGVAQMSKKEAKEWKKRIKKLTPEQYKSLLDENKSIKGQVSILQTEMAGVDQTIADKDSQINQYQTQVDDLRGADQNVRNNVRNNGRPKAAGPRTT